MEAQSAAVEAYARSTGLHVLATYTEVETGKKDSLENRPQLRRAVSHAKRAKAVLIVAKLDRLSRSVAVTSLLHQSGVEFVCVDNPNANRLTVQILAAVAEAEAKAISDRTREALAAYKARGGVLGARIPQCQNLTRSARLKGSAQAAMTRRAQAREAYTDLLQELRRFKGRGLSLRSIAKQLNSCGQTTRRGRPWSAMQVKRVLDRHSAE